ncbi:hypothetical protein Taro_043563 [Colocasia esculenta]|uniref:Reverse transcriptase zinc-binding domain-containing protein n=1 Tax=Colocasia esculenta TaxID=4460 RepID=A0A843WW44_COLES|nr:hypothetical protein [Colocasia esculenta]
MEEAPQPRGLRSLPGGPHTSIGEQGGGGACDSLLLLFPARRRLPSKAQQQRQRQGSWAAAAKRWPQQQRRQREASGGGAASSSRGERRRRLRCRLVTTAAAATAVGTGGARLPLPAAASAASRQQPLDPSPSFTFSPSSCGGSKLIVVTIGGQLGQRWELHGEFAYMMIADDDFTHDLQAQVWRPQSPLKVKVLIWRISLGQLPTRDRLIRFLPDIQSYCVLCGIEEETIDHLFVGCFYAQAVWEAVAASTQGVILQEGGGPPVRPPASQEGRRSGYLTGGPLRQSGSSRSTPAGRSASTLALALDARAREASAGEGTPAGRTCREGSSTLVGASSSWSSPPAFARTETPQVQGAKAGVKSPSPPAAQACSMAAVTYGPQVIACHAKCGYLAVLLVFGDFPAMVGSPYFLGVVPTVQATPKAAPKATATRGTKPRSSQGRVFSVNTISCVAVPRKRGQRQGHRGTKPYAVVSNSGKTVLVGDIRVRLDHGWQSRVGWVSRTQPTPTRVGSDPWIRPTPMESGRPWVGQVNKGILKPCPKRILKLHGWVVVPPPKSGRQGPTRLRVGRLRPDSADFAIYGLDGGEPILPRDRSVPAVATFNQFAPLQGMRQEDRDSPKGSRQGQASSSAPQPPRKMRQMWVTKQEAHQIKQARADQPAERPKKATPEREKAQDPEPPRPRGHKRRGIYRKLNFVSTRAEPAEGETASHAGASAPRVSVFERLSASVFSRLGATIRPSTQKPKKRRVQQTSEKGGGMKIFTCYASGREAAGPSGIPAEALRINESGQDDETVLRYTRNVARRLLQGQQGSQAGPLNLGQVLEPPLEHDQRPLPGQSLIRKGKIDPEGNSMVLMRAREAAQREFEESDYMRFKSLQAPEADERGWLVPPMSSIADTEGASLGQQFRNISLKEQPTSRYNQEDPDMAEVGSSDEAPALWYLGWRVSPNPFATAKIGEIFEKLLQQGCVKAHRPPPTYTEREINHPMYCKYHAILLHPTDMCPIVRDWVKSLIQKGKIDSEGNPITQSEATEEAQQQIPRRKKGSRQYQVSPPHEQTPENRSTGQRFENSPPRILKRQHKDRRGKEPAMEPAAQEANPYWDEFQELPPGVIEQAIDSTFQHQQDEAGWTTVASRMRPSLAFPKRGGSHGRPAREDASWAPKAAKELTPLEMARALKREKNRQKNMKRRLKERAEQAEAATTPAELTPLQKLQMLINELEEYIPSKPTWGVPLDIYIPWEEMERKTRLKSWLHQMLQRAQEGEKLPLPEELAIFYKEDEITIEKLEEMLKDFSCNMVSIPPPASLQSPAVTPLVATYRCRNRGKGRGRGRGKKSAPSLSEKANSPDLSKTIVFRGEKPQPAPEMEVRANSFIFDPSDEEEEEQQDIASGLSDRRATQPVLFVLSDEEECGGWAIPNKPSHRKTPESAVRPTPSKSGREETTAPEEDSLSSLFEEKPDGQPGTRRVNQFGQPIKALEDIVPPLDQLRARADRKIIQHMKRFPTNITIWDAIAWSKELRTALVKILQEPELYFGEPPGKPATASKGKEKQNADANQASQDQEEEELFTVNKDLLEARRLSRLAESTTPGPSCSERREINYEANTVGEIINRSISLPPAYMQLPFHREEQWVERLKTFIVTHYRNDSLKKGKTPKPIIFYKGDPLPYGPLEDDFGWSQVTQVAPEPVQEMDDMHEHIKQLCQRQKIAQMQDPSRREYFHQLWYPKQLRGQPPYCAKDTRGLGYGQAAECEAYYTVNTVGLAPSPNHCPSDGRSPTPATKPQQGEAALMLLFVTYHILFRDDDLHHLQADAGCINCLFNNFRRDLVEIIHELLSLLRDWLHRSFFCPVGNDNIHIYLDIVLDILGLDHIFVVTPHQTWYSLRQMSADVEDASPYTIDWTCMDVELVAPPLTKEDQRMMMY